MIRRRRRVREIAFSFDSFLDVVANVVGIIIRLILVVWVGARSYTGLQYQVAARPAEQTQAEMGTPTDPLQDQLAQQRRELADAQAQLLEQMRQLQQTRDGQPVPAGELAALTVRRQNLERERADLDKSLAGQSRAKEAVALSAAELRQRSRRLGEEIQALKKLPPLKKTYRYKTPVSQPVQSEELLFECLHGRIAFIDIGPMLREARENMREKGELLRDQWEVSGIAGPIGAFRLRYLVERQRSGVEEAVSGGVPGTKDDFRYGLTGWVVEPILSVRGETVDEALAAKSEFRGIVDVLDPRQTVVTFFVYPDSFPQFRQVRDYLYDRDIVVAGRPLPDGAPIMSSRNGTRSRGQ
jgi:hypothetical protein